MYIMFIGYSLYRSTSTFEDHLLKYPSHLHNQRTFNIFLPFKLSSAPWDNPIVKIKKKQIDVTNKLFVILKTNKNSDVIKKISVW